MSNVQRKVRRADGASAITPAAASLLRPQIVATNLSQQQVEP